MNEKNNDQNQKKKTSKLAKASIICLGVFFGLVVARVVIPLLSGILILLFGFFSSLISEHEVVTDLSGPSVPHWLEMGFYLALKCTFFGAPTLGISALIHIRLSKERLRGIGLAKSAIVVSIAIFLFFMGAPHLKSYLQRSVYVSLLKQIGTAMKLYANDYDGQLPTPQNWCDLLVTQDEFNEGLLSGHRNRSDAMWGESAYALNKSVVSLKLSDIPGDVVLLFETTYGRTDSERDTPRKTRTYFAPNYKRTVRFGKSLVYKDRWNQVGGPDILTTEYQAGNGCYILFADGSARFVKKEDLDTLRWET